MERKKKNGSNPVELACRNADWQQVVMNGGPPCFHIEDGRFCFRAERWPGHGVHHTHISLLDFINGLSKSKREGE